MIVGPLSQGGDQTELVERRRPQSVDQTADLADVPLGLVGEPTHEVCCAVGVGADQLEREVEIHRHAGQRRAEPVVEVAADPATLLLTS